MLLTNFLLSKAKRELSPQLYRIPKCKEGAINQAVKSVIKDIDSILFKYEGKTTKEYFEKTPRRYEALETVLSYLVQEGFSQVRQEQISKKSGISVPLINFILKWLEDLEVCHQIKTRRHNKIAPSIYILSLHNNYLKIIEYFKQKWALTIDIFSTFTEFLSKKIGKKKHKDTNKKEDAPVSTCHGFNLFTPIEETVEIEAEEKETEEQETNPKEDKKLELRFQEMDDHMSDAQKKLYMYILTQDTNITEKDAYTIALRMPPDVDWEVKKTFEDCVKHFELNKSQVSTPAHFIKIYTEQLTANKARRDCEAKENLANTEFGKPYKSTIDFGLFREGMGFKK
ncbi:TPA: Replicase RepFR55 [Bacillus thuringiensis]|uniref:Replicase RepFR55 n=1 Tax=Bacillus thuringiensis serovar iberica TaxID=180866 RepID=A0A9X6LFM2_BACTU|nr:Replicase RepFR55 [Bacillus thuringiensis]MEB9625234.1 Replicase RepFR55 [Bacillus cereus]OUB44876.1 Replicase RepFR55 [Bacillus thuringiensis serovar iberica]HDR5353529.1 Replicase RepFR55 [Bacillus thuringiensis]